jgi:hypothetical protein
MKVNMYGVAIARPLRIRSAAFWDFCYAQLQGDRSTTSAAVHACVCMHMHVQVLPC